MELDGMMVSASTGTPRGKERFAKSVPRGKLEGGGWQKIFDEVQWGGGGEKTGCGGQEYALAGSGLESWEDGVDQ